jgi:type IV pilus assembly protein PilA
MKRAAGNDSEGFTLIELLVVMIIIGILAAIAIPLFLNNRHKAFETRAKADVTDIVEHATAYYIDKTGVLTASGGPSGDWSLSDAGGVVETSKLSDGDKVVGSDIRSDTLFCVAVQHFDGAAADSRAWTYDQDGLHVGNTC